MGNTTPLQTTLTLNAAYVNSPTQIRHALLHPARQQSTSGVPNTTHGNVRPAAPRRTDHRTSLNFSQDGDLFRYHSFYDSGHVGLDYFLFNQHEGKSFGAG